MRIYPFRYLLFFSERILNYIHYINNDHASIRIIIKCFYIITMIFSMKTKNDFLVMVIIRRNRIYVFAIFSFTMFRDRCFFCFKNKRICYTENYMMVVLTMLSCNECMSSKPFYLFFNITIVVVFKKS